MRRLPALLAALAVMMVMAVLPSVTSGALDDSDVFVVHGVPGLDVDVYVNGALTLPGFEPEEIAGPLTLGAGDYDVEIFAAVEAPAAMSADRTDVAPISETVPLPGGLNVSLVAHLDASGAPVLGGFANDVSATEIGQARATARHTAAAPEVNVLADGGVLFPDVPNGAEGVIEVPAGSYDLGVQVAPDGPVVLSLDDAALGAGVNTIVYVIGSASAGTLTAVVQTIDVGELPEASDVFVVHGVPGLDVDVYVNGALTLPGFEPAEIAGPLTLPAGDYDVEIFAAVAEPPAMSSDRGDGAAIDESVALPGGVSASLVAHLDAGGVPVLGVFVNDVSATGFGQARATARHTAAAPEVNVLADGGVLFPDVPNGAEGVIEVPAGSYDLGVQVAPDGPVVLSLDDAALGAGVNTIVYVIGSASAGTLTAVVQTIDVGELPGFTDVGPSHPFLAEITWMAANGYANGFPDGTFRPTVGVTRQAFSAFASRYLTGDAPLEECTEAPFSDVGVDHPFCAEITFMTDEGLVNGFPDGTFRPTAQQTRQATAAIFYRMAGSPDGAAPTCDVAPFTDVATTNPFCGEITWMVDAGITTGFPDDTFRPANNSTRQAMSAFLFRFDEWSQAAAD